MTSPDKDRPHSRALRTAVHLAHRLRLATLARETEKTPANARKAKTFGAQAAERC